MLLLLPMVPDFREDLTPFCARFVRPDSNTMVFMDTTSKLSSCLGNVEFLPVADIRHAKLRDLILVIPYSITVSVDNPY